MKKKIVYSEPEDYFPTEIRQKMKIGEFAEKPEEDDKKEVVDEEAEKHRKGEL